MGQKSKINKKAYLYVTDIDVNLSRNFVGSSPSQVHSPSLQKFIRTIQAIFTIFQDNLIFQDKFRT